MKRIFTIIYSALFISLITVPVVSGQENKNEQKIKIIMDDGTGEKIIVDTMLYGSQMTDSLRLKNGKVIFVGHHGDETDTNHGYGNKQVFVTVSDDGKETKKVIKEITIHRSDSATWDEADDCDRIYVYNDSKGHAGRSADQHNAMQWSDKDGNNTDEKIIIINDRKKTGKEGEETMSYTVTSDNFESDGERTKYVINKDGMVITIEGDDYNKVKALVNEIGSKLDAKKDAEATVKPAKAEPKKSVKK